MRRTTLENIVKLMGVASKDLTRPQLNTVCIEVNEKQDSITLVATDGQKLASVELEDDILYNAIKVSDKQQILIETQNKSMLQAALKKDKNQMCDESTKISVSGHLNTWGISIHLLDRDYPRWRQVLPSKDAEFYHTVSLNVEYLKQLVDALHSAGKIHKQVTLKIPKESENKPVLVQMLRSNLTPEHHCVIMPVKPE